MWVVNGVKMEPEGGGMFVMCVLPSVVVIDDLCLPNCTCPIEEVIKLVPLVSRRK